MWFRKAKPSASSGDPGPIYSHHLAAVAPLKAPAALVEQAVMRSAHQQKIGFSGAPSMGPGVEVVDVAPARGAIASREPATLVGEHHAPPQWRRRGAHGAPKVERVAGFVHHHRGERGVVGDALHRLRRDRVAAQQLAGGRPRRSAQPLQLAVTIR